MIQHIQEYKSPYFSKLCEIIQIARTKLQLLHKELLVLSILEKPVLFLSEEADLGVASQALEAIFTGIQHTYRRFEELCQHLGVQGQGDWGISDWLRGVLVMGISHIVVVKCTNYLSEQQIGEFIHNL